MWRHGKATFAQAIRDESEKFQRMRIEKYGIYRGATVQEESNYLLIHKKAIKEMIRKAFEFAERHYIGHIIVEQTLNEDHVLTLSPSDPYEDDTTSYLHRRGTSILGRYFNTDGTPTNKYCVWQQREDGWSLTGEIKDANWNYDTCEGFCFEEEDSTQLEKMVRYVQNSLPYQAIDVHSIERDLTQLVFNFTAGKKTTHDEEQDSKNDPSRSSFSGIYVATSQGAFTAQEHQMLFEMLLREQT